MSRISEQVELKIIQNINNDIYETNSYLPSERSLAEEFNVSRSVIREAIFGLQARGYIILKERHRPIVTKPNLAHVAAGLNALFSSSKNVNLEKRVKNIGQIRCILEQEAAIELSLYGSKDDLDQLFIALEENKEAKSDYGLFQQKDMAFHHALFCSSQNDLLVEAHSLITDWLMHYFDEESAKYKSIDTILQQHEDIAEAIKLKNIEDIIQNIRHHLQFYQNNIV